MIFGQFFAIVAELPKHEIQNFGYPILHYIPTVLPYVFALVVFSIKLWIYGLVRYLDNSFSELYENILKIDIAIKVVEIKFIFELHCITPVVDKSLIIFHCIVTKISLIKMTIRIMKSAGLVAPKKNCIESFGVRAGPLGSQPFLTSFACDIRHFSAK